MQKYNDTCRTTFLKSQFTKIWKLVGLIHQPCAIQKVCILCFRYHCHSRAHASGCAYAFVKLLIKCKSPPTFHKENEQRSRETSKESSRKVFCESSDDDVRDHRSRQMCKTPALLAGQLIQSDMVRQEILLGNKVKFTRVAKGWGDRRPFNVTVFRYILRVAWSPRRRHSVSAVA